MCGGKLTTVPSSITHLHAGSSASQYQPIILRTDDFDDLNQWIGIPDQVFDEIDPLYEPPKRGRLLDFAAATKEKAPSESLTANRQPSVESHSVARDLARAYLFGDARKLQPYKDFLKRHFSVVDVAVWAFPDILIKSGSVLEVGAGANVLLASSITIEQGGTLRCLGHVRVDATILEKVKPPHWIVTNPALAAVEWKFRQE
jgi:hypothetical protein